MPNGSKIWVAITTAGFSCTLLDLGSLNADAALVKKGANQWSPNVAPQIHERRESVMISLLVFHPEVGLFLFDTGSCEEIISSWDKHTIECTPRRWVKEKHGLPAAIRKTGNDINDVKAVILSHLHMDHAGGLEHFINTGTTISILSLAVRLVANSEPKIPKFGATNPSIKALSGSVGRLRKIPFLRGLKWRTFSQDIFEIFRGVTLHRCPGHTEGLCVIEFRLPSDETFIYTSDLFHVKENYEDGHPQGNLITDENSWLRSRFYVQHLVQRTSAMVLLGHDTDYFSRFTRSPGWIS
ncbi:hypothetical protein N7476_011597 [Penicillium atrosanguineum]|uniref:Metallo-beta-lactamase domain-containing protein n=1 Tax=Penicillium atrosanguineum TaxID=1132637 RepID=A0A9W9PMX0_9EURO|nr:hypothetical protein N7476_011597 [Penicillium atrosanguineum]